MNEIYLFTQFILIYMYTQFAFLHQIYRPNAILVWGPDDWEASHLVPRLTRFMVQYWMAGQVQCCRGRFRGGELRGIPVYPLSMAH